jgi:hypothetical protein
VQDSTGVVFTTIQKFLPEQKGDTFPLLSDRRNIVVIADEAQVQEVEELHRWTPLHGGIEEAGGRHGNRDRGTTLRRHEDQSASTAWAFSNDARSCACSRSVFFTAATMPSRPSMPDVDTLRGRAGPRLPARAIAT